MILLGWLLSSCNSHSDDIALAKAGSEYLYVSDIKGLVAEGTSAVDSATIVNNYINAWVEQQLMAEKASEELPSNKKDFERQLSLYKQALLIQAYENYYVEKNLDTTVAEKEINSYYQSHSAEFELKSNILQLNFVKFRIAHPSINRVKQLLFSRNPNKKAITAIADKEAENYFLDDKIWLLFDDITKELPLHPYQSSQLLPNTQLELKDSLYHYLIVIKDFKIKDEVSPLIYERENIKAIILNSRRSKLIEKLKSEIKKEASDHADFEIFQKQQK